jgi:DNA-binding Lrp family transcriptional regulator
MSEIGRKIGLHEGVVASRVKRLWDKKIITEFFTDVNIKKLGLTPVRFYFTYQYVNPLIKKEIIDYFVNSPYTHAVHSTKGHYDLTVILLVENIPMHYSFWNEALNKYRDYFTNQVLTIHNTIIEYKNTFLISEKPEKSEKRFLFIEEAEEKPVKIDDLDLKILRSISRDSRKKISQVSKDLNIAVNTVNYRINKLIKTGVIHCFRATIDLGKIVYYWYKVDIILKDLSIGPMIIEIIEENPFLFAIIKSLGYVDVELLFCFEDINQLHEIMNDLSAMFPGQIKNYYYFTTVKTHKYSFTP